MSVIHLKDVWEQYRIKFVRDKRVSWEHIWALQDINLEVEKGECVGIIGENGAGKTTLLKVIAGMLCPDKGDVNVEGRVSCLMELGTGFHPELTGRENVFLNAGLYGLSKEEIENKFDQIVEFSGIGKFIDATVKSYSQGMYMRLAFALAIHVDPDILLIDDILAIGDEATQRKCIRKIFELKKKGITTLFVTHDMNLIRLFCSRVIHLNKGRIFKDGSAEEIITAYLNNIKNNDAFAFRQKELNVESYIIQKNDLRLLCDLGQKQIKLYYTDKEITQDSGLYTEICCAGKWYYPSNAFWLIKRQTQEEILLVLEYPQISLTQFWQIELKEDDIIDIDIDIESTKKNIITHRNIGFEFNNKYTNWVTPYEEGNFQDSQYGDKIRPIRLKNCKVEKIGLKPNLKEELPGLTIDFSSDNLKRTVFLNKKIEQEIEKINLKYSEIILYKDRNLLPGRHKYLKSKLFINKELKLMGEVLDTSNKIKEGQLFIVFNEGSGRIFYKDKELSVGLGMYTSLCSLGVWYDSYQAIWDIQRLEDTKIIAVGFWPYIPLSQIWRIILLDEHTISWQIETEIYGRFDNLELEQINLMITPLYTNWIALERNQGTFLDDFTEFYDSSPYRFWYGPAKGNIKALASGLPSVSFIYSGEENISLRTVIENSDNLYKGRRLQYQRICPRNVNNHIQSKYFFEGIIRIELD